ncbi:MAG: hypothetical protein JWQ02_4345 [Capsulimonas sp.]|nr:hypothetical protein [Capsulimonas sp.]
MYRAVEHHEFDLWAYVLMPEHVHILVRPVNDQYKISDLMFALKQPVTAKAKRHFLATGASAEKQEPFWDIQPNGRGAFRFWQRGGGYDRNLWSEDEISKTINYIHQNPVRRGLCERPAEWEWSSARGYEEGADASMITF